MLGIMERQVSWAFQLLVVLFGIKLWAISMSKCWLELTCLWGKWECLLRLTNRCLELWWHPSLSHQLLLKLLLSSLFHPITNFVHSANLVYLFCIKVFGQSLLNNVRVIDLRVECEIFFAAFIFIVLFSFVTFFNKPSLMFRCIKIHATISMGSFAFLCVTFVV